MITAFSQGLLARVLGLTHRDIMWLPQTRPGRSVYAGYEGTAQLMADARSNLGPFRVVIDQRELVADGLVRLRGWRIRTQELAEPFDLLVAVREGLVTRVDSQDVRPSSDPST